MAKNVAVLKSDYLSHFLKTIHVFSDLDVSDLEKIKQVIYRKHFKKKEMVFSEGETDVPLYLLEAGKVKVYKNSSTGKEQTLWMPKPGDIFCIVTMFKPSAPANIQAIEDTMAYAIDKKDLHWLINNSPKISFNLLKYFADRLVNFTSMIEDISFSDVSIRLAKLLLEHCIKDDNGADVCPLNQTEIASMVGSAREVVCRALKKMESTGIISVKYSKVLISDISGLRNILEKQ